jgi:hypothetical protein
MGRRVRVWRVGHESIYLKWKNVTADERDGSIFLSMTETEHPEEFLKITLTPAALV